MVSGLDKFDQIWDKYEEWKKKFKGKFRKAFRKVDVQSTKKVQKGFF